MHSLTGVCTEVTLNMIPISLSKLFYHLSMSRLNGVFSLKVLHVGQRNEITSTTFSALERIYCTQNLLYKL